MNANVITIRQAKESDAERLGELLTASYTRLLKPDYAPSVQVTAIPIISKPNRALVNSGTYYVAEGQGGGLLGAGGWTRSVKGPNAADIRHFVTHHAALRQGIASRLLSDVMSEARAAGISTLHCLSTRTAVPFYRSMGFEGSKEIAIGLRPGIEFPAIRMSRVI